MPLSRSVIQAANDATYAAWSSGDVEGVLSVFAPNAVLVEQPTGEVYHGLPALRERAAGLFKAFPDFQLKRISLLIDGNENSDRWLMTGTHLGRWNGVPATRRQIEIHGSTFTRFNEDGLVEFDINYYDGASVLRQFGPIAIPFFGIDRAIRALSGLRDR